MAVGNPFGLGGNSVTVGVVSFKGRALDLSTHGTPIEMLQTDAAINPGNSGGPLINARGEAVGINTLIMTDGAQQYSGVGFAVPINVARNILPQLREKGHVVRGRLGVQVQSIDEDLAKSLKMNDTRGAIVSNVTSGSPAAEAGLEAGDVVRSLDGKLGVAVETLTPDVAQQVDVPAGHGVVITKVQPGSPADNAGLQERDVVVSVDGQPVRDASAFRSVVENTKPGDILRLRVRRGEGYLFVAVRPA
jgi:serine protease Do